MTPSASCIRSDASVSAAVGRGRGCRGRRHALTSVGGVKSYEIAMYLVENLYGKEVTAGIAEGLVMDWDIEALRYVRGK